MEQKKYMVNARTGEVRATYKLAYFTEHDRGVVWFEQETLPTNTNPDYLKTENGIVVDKTQAEIDLFDAIREFQRIKESEFLGFRYRIEVPFPYVVEKQPALALWILGKKTVDSDISDAGVSKAYFNIILPAFVNILQSDTNFRIFDSEDLNPQPNE